MPADPAEADFTMPTESEPVVVIEGDCREILPLLPAGCVDAVLTDPPYGLGSKLAGGTWGAKFGGGLEWDQSTPDLSAIISLAKYSIVWGGNYFALPATRCYLIWWKPDAVKTMADCEFAWTNLDANARVLRHSIAATNAERNGHPTQKPLAVMRWAIRQLPTAVDVILDPFAGSGTTGVAAIAEGRRAILIEKDPTYAAIARKRVQQAMCRQPGSLFAEVP